MEFLKKKIREEGIVIGEDILKVDSILNHQMDIELFMKIGEAFYERFKNANINKILTIEASGIGIAAIAATYFKVPVVFAKKSQSRILNGTTYSSEVYSFTKQQSFHIHVSDRFLSQDDQVLIIDDFLANGQAALGLIELVKAAKGSCVGVGIVIEKGFQDGGKLLRDQGIRVESLAIVDRFTNGEIRFL